MNIVRRIIQERILYPFRRPAPPPPRTQMGFFTDTTLCIGCKACEVACKQWNQLPADGFKWSGKSYDNTMMLSASTWRHVTFIEQFGAAPDGVNGNGASMVPGGYGSAHGGSGSILETLLAQPKSGRWLMMSDVCKHCAEAPCQLACPTGAIIHNEFADVYIQNDICNGCGYCVAACPFGVITRSEVDGHAHKCTLCYDRQRDGMTPACAKACPTESIMFGPIEEARTGPAARRTASSAGADRSISVRRRAHGRLSGFARILPVAGRARIIWSAQPSIFPSTAPRRRLPADGGRGRADGGRNRGAILHPLI
jgi:formate dehydrogenase iron-sulfur subunit